MLDFEFVLICLGIILAPAIVPPLAVVVLELIGGFVGGLMEVVEGITTPAAELEAREQAAKEREEEWYWYKIGHNSYRLK